MQSDRQHIDDFFRAKNDAWDPGSGDLQQNWQQLLVMMPKTTGHVDSKPSCYRLVKLPGGIVAVSVMIAILVMTLKRAEKEKTVVENQLPQKNEALKEVASPPAHQKDTVVIMQVIKENQTLPTISTLRDTVAFTTPATTREAPKPGAEVWMRDFYDAIKKESQSFNIPADRDTTVIGKEGTVVNIKANTFIIKSGPRRVTITLTEYYQYDDMLAAKLNTFSEGMQLVTGGMLHLQAEVNGQPVKMAPGKTIELKMPTDNYDQDMQLFVDASQLRYEHRGDTTAAGTYGDGSRVNWIPAGQSQRLFGESNRNIDIIDLSASPYRVSYRKNKTVGKFFYDEWDGFDAKTLKEELYKRYGTYYDKIKLRKAGKRERREAIEEKNMDFEQAATAGLVFADDSARYYKQRAKDSAYYSRQLGKLKYYRFEVTSLGWINCDRFYQDPRPLTDLTVDLGEGYNAGDFVTHLVFTRIRSVMNGLYIGSRVQFRSIPENEPVQLVSVGIKDGKVVSTITPYTVGKKEQKSPVFEETSPEAFRQRLEVLNKRNSPQ
jgi:hypothetical protein